MSANTPQPGDTIKISGLFDTNLQLSPDITLEVEIDVTQSGDDPDPPSIQTLVDGGVDINTWTTFDFGTDGDGQGLNIVSTQGTGDARIGSNQIPCAFLTPWKNDADDCAYVDVIIHPYCGYDVNNNPNDFTIYLYLNGGTPVVAAPRTRTSAATGETYTVYSAQVPTLTQDDNEVRAVVIPRLGQPAILQRGCLQEDRTSGGSIITRAGNWNSESIPTQESIALSDQGYYTAAEIKNQKGVFIHKYIDVNVGPDQAYKTVHEAVEGYASDNGGSGFTYNLRCNLVGSTYDTTVEAADALLNSSGSPVATNGIFTYAHCAHNPDTRDETGTRARPIVTSNGSGIVVGSDINWASVKMYEGHIIKNCKIYNWMPSDATYANRDDSDVSSFIASGATKLLGTRTDSGIYYHYENCEIGLPNDNSYTNYRGSVADGGSGITAKDEWVSEGLSYLVKLWDIGLSPSYVGLGIKTEGKGSTLSAAYNCTTKFTSFNVGTAVDTKFICPSIGGDIINGTLGVGCLDTGASESVYPFFSGGADVIKAAGGPFNWDYTQTTWSGMALEYSYDAIQAAKDNPALATNAGIFPDFIGGGDTTTQRVGDDEFFGNGDGTYTDHHGFTTSGWNSEVLAADGHSVTDERDQVIWKGQDPHFDTFQLTLRRVLGPVIVAHHRSPGDQQDRQVIFFTSASGDSCAVWDVQCQASTSFQVANSLGYTGLAATGNSPNLTSQHWGPDYFYATVDDPTGESVAQPMRNGTGSDASSNGFIYAASTDVNYDVWWTNEWELDGEPGSANEFEPVVQQNTAEAQVPDDWYLVRTDFSDEYLVYTEIREDGVEATSYTEREVGNVVALTAFAGTNQNDVQYSWAVTSDDGNVSDVVTTTGTGTSFNLEFTAASSRTYTITLTATSAALGKTVTSSITCAAVAALAYPVTVSGNAEYWFGGQIRASEADITWEDDDGNSAAPLGLYQIRMGSFDRGIEFLFLTEDNRDVDFLQRYAGRTLTITTNGAAVTMKVPVSVPVPSIQLKNNPADSGNGVPATYQVEFWSDTNIEAPSAQKDLFFDSFVNTSISSGQTIPYTIVFDNP